MRLELAVDRVSEQTDNCTRREADMEKKFEDPDMLILIVSVVNYRATCMYVLTLFTQFQNLRFGQIVFVIFRVLLSG